MRNLLVGLVLFLSISASFAATTFGLRPDGKLNQPAISRSYKESDWEQVQNVLETYLKRKSDSQISDEEKVFAYKHLGVIYAADSVTHTRAESYFNRLLDMAPKAEIIDMYPSKKILAFFREVRNDHETQLSYNPKNDLTNRQTPSNDAGQVSITPIRNDTMLTRKERSPQPISKRQIKSKDNNGSWLWWAAGVTAVGAGVGVYVLSQQRPDSPDPQKYTVDIKK